MTFKKQAHYPIHIDKETIIEHLCYHYLNKQDTPHLIEQLSQGTLFQVTNPKTNEVIPFTYPCLYEDRQKKLLIFFIPDNIVPIEKLSHTLFEGSPTNIDDYTIRYTTTLTEFFEKINILDSQKLDTEIECVKVLTHALLTEQKQFLDTPIQLYFNEQNHDTFLLITPETQTSVVYNTQLQDIVHKRLGKSLYVSKGIIHHIDPNWAIKQLHLD